MGFVKLIKVTEGNADKIVQEMGWKNDEHFAQETGSSAVGYWADDEEDQQPNSDFELPKDAKEVTLEPILIIVHSRLFRESAEGYQIDDDTAYIDEFIYEGLF